MHRSTRRISSGKEERASDEMEERCEGERGSGRSGREDV
jgi:hypothetical protein